MIEATKRIESFQFKGGPQFAGGIIGRAPIPTLPGLTELRDAW